MSAAVKATHALVLPSLPPIDKYWAALRLIFDNQDQGIRFRFAFCAKNEADENDLEVWNAGTPGSAVLLDIGGLKYHGQARSASEFEFKRSETKRSHIWNSGVPLINLNNATGFLKRLPHSIPALMRSIPHVFETRDRGEQETFHQGLSVVRTMFRPQDRREWSELFENPEYSELLRMWKGFEVSDNYHVEMPGKLTAKLSEMIEDMNSSNEGLNLRYENVVRLLPGFTLPGYFRGMFLAGDAPGEIFRRMSWWLDHAGQVDTLRFIARDKTYQFETFELPSSEGPVTCGVVHIKDFFEGEAFTHKHLGMNDNPFALPIIRMPTGGALFQTSIRHRVDIRPLAEKLKEVEPKRWYSELRFVDRQAQILMNQSWQFVKVPKTGFTDDELVVWAQMYAEYHGRV